jgi:hypothetical protein
MQLSIGTIAQVPGLRWHSTYLLTEPLGGGMSMGHDAEIDQRIEQEKEAASKTLNTGQPAITGYRNLSIQEVAIMNTIKDLGNRVAAIIALVDNNPETDKRWVSIARTDLQKGFMSLTRAVAKPTSF